MVAATRWLVLLVVLLTIATEYTCFPGVVAGSRILPSDEADTTPGPNNTTTSNIAPGASLCPTFASALGLGDSTTDTGNDIINNPAVFNNSAHFPYGETFFNKSTGRYSDGRLMVDYLMTALGQPLLTPYLYVRPSRNNNNKSSSHATLSLDQRTHQNFAFSGATALDEATLIAIAGQRMRQSIFTKIDLAKEIRWFDAAIGEQGIDLRRSVVYFGEIGGNDYNYAIGSGDNVTTIVPRLIRPVIGRLTSAINHLLRKGVRHLIVQAQFPQGCLSLYMTIFRGLAMPVDYDSHGCVTAVNRISARHNQLLREVVDNARKAYPEAEIVYLDTYYAYVHLLENAASYNITNTVDACDPRDALRFSGQESTAFVPRMVNTCTNPQNYLSWDSVHMTDATYGILSTLFITDRRFSSPYPNFLSRCAYRVTSTNSSMIPS